jgi:hypothetical protein
LILNARVIGYDLTGDELFYARQSQIHSWALINQIRQEIPSFILDVNSKYVFQSVSIVLLATIVIYIKMTFKIQRDLIFMAVTVISLLTIRQLIQSLNPNNHVLSPLPSVWYFLTSSVFGYHTQIYRASTLALYSLLATVIYFWFKGSSYMSKTVAVLTALLLFSIPLVSQMSVSVEPANWTFLVIVIFLLILIRNHYYISETLILLVSLSFYLRMNIAFLLAAAVLTHLVQELKAHRRLSSIYYISSLIVLPGIVFTFISRISVRIASNDNVIEALTSNLKNTFITTQKASGVIYLILAISTTFILLMKRKTGLFISSYMLFAFLLFQILQFPILSGFIKYSAEYIYPLVLILPLLIFSHVSLFKHLVYYFLIPSLLSLNIYGISLKSEIANTLRQVYLNNNSKEVYAPGRVMPFVPFPYRDIFLVIKENNYSGCFNGGAVYGVFPEIQAGYSLREVLLSSDVRNRFLESGNGSADITLEAVNEAGLSCIIVGFVDNQVAVVDELDRRGWKVARISIDKNFGTKVFLMVRENYLN